jgi:fimbrial chaperone protein
MNAEKRSRFDPKRLLVPVAAGLASTFLLGPAPALAGNFTVTPVRIYIAPKDRAVAVTITNEADEELVLQADLYQWKQKPDGKDDLVLSEDLFLSPPIIKLAPKARQVVRLARVNATPPVDQLTYRMIVREIPEAKPPKDSLEVQIALAFSLPVFITPPTAKRQIGCTVERASGGAVRALCENKGNAYAYPTGFVLTAENGEVLVNQEVGGGYILPGIKRSFDLKRKDGKIPSGKAKLEVPFDDGTKESYDVTVGD